MTSTEQPDLGLLQNAVNEIRAAIGTVIVGQHDMTDLIIAAVLADGHVLLEGVPGVAKTLAAKLTARMLDCSFSRIQFTPDLMPADILGTSVFNPKSLDFTYRQGPVFANIVLADEINRSPAKTQAALMEVMEERQVSSDGSTMPLPRPFIVLATQNPIEQEGTYRLPEAQLDRFLFKIDVQYPTVEEEKEILRRHHERRGQADLSAIRPLLTTEQVVAYRRAVQSVTVEEHLLGYVAAIVSATRSHAALDLGASPRASIGMLNAAKAIAVMRGRDFVIPEDIQEMAVPVLRHRVQLTPEKEMEGLSPDTVIADIVRSIDVPR